MTKQHFIELADVIRAANTDHTDGNTGETAIHFTGYAINALADFCKSQNPNFNRQRWLDYIEGKCGQNGGRVKA
jgi:hypothetical protein